MTSSSRDAYTCLQVPTDPRRVAHYSLTHLIRCAGDGGFIMGKSEMNMEQFKEALVEMALAKFPNLEPVRPLTIRSLLAHNNSFTIRLLLNQRLLTIGSLIASCRWQLLIDCSRHTFYLLQPHCLSWGSLLILTSKARPAHSSVCWLRTIGCALCASA